MASYVVVADTLYTTDADGGNERKHVKGDTVDLSADDAKRHKASGAVASKSADDAKEAIVAAEVAAANAAAGGGAPVAHEPEGGSASTLAAVSNSVPLGDDDLDVDGVAAGPVQHGPDAAAIVTAGNTNEVRRPPKAADKSSWVAYAVFRGATFDEANAMSKPDLIAKYGGE